MRRREFIAVMAVAPLLRLHHVTIGTVPATLFGPSEANTAKFQRIVSADQTVYAISGGESMPVWRYASTLRPGDGLVLCPVQIGDPVDYRNIEIVVAVSS